MHIRADVLASMNPVRELRQQVGVAQADLARRGETSQPTIAAYESGTKSPTFRTLERLAASVGKELHVVYVPVMTREDRRSLELHRAIASKLLTQPDAMTLKAKQNIVRMTRSNPHASPLLSEWRRLLRRSAPEIADLLVDPRPHARELRHVTPFAGVLTPAERWSVYRRFQFEDRST